MCIIDCLSTIVFILPLHLDYTKVIILILWWRNFQLEYWRTFQLVSTLSKIGCNSDTNRILQKLVQMAGINKKITYHTARHTCATLLVHQGVPITTVQRILGHTSVRTTQIYSDVFAETLIKDLTLANEKSSLKNMEIVKRNRKKANNNTEKVPLAIE
jgi:integrase